MCTFRYFLILHIAMDFDQRICFKQIDLETIIYVRPCIYCTCTYNDVKTEIKQIQLNTSSLRTPNMPVSSMYAMCEVYSIASLHCPHPLTSVCTHIVPLHLAHWLGSSNHDRPLTAPLLTALPPPHAIGIRHT